MKNVIVSIGNSDNKLAQHEWSQFVEQVSVFMKRYSHQQLFFGGSANWEPWQNVAWWVLIADDDAEILKRKLKESKKLFGQDSIAWLEGETLFL